MGKKREKEKKEKKSLLLTKTVIDTNINLRHTHIYKINKIQVMLPTQIQSAES